MWHAQFCLVSLVSELQWRKAKVRYCCSHARHHEDVWRIGDTTPCVLNLATRWRWVADFKLRTPFVRHVSGRVELITRIDSVENWKYPCGVFSFPATNCISWQLLVAFAKLRKATFSFVMSLCLSFRMEQLDSHWTDFHEIWYLSIFRKCIDNIQILLKSDKNNIFYTKTDIHFWYLAQSSEWTRQTMFFIVTPCISDIKHFIIQLMYTTWKRRFIKTY